jgi:hypothetical protein
MKLFIFLIIVLFLNGCNGMMVSLSARDPHPGMGWQFRPSQHSPGEGLCSSQKDSPDKMITNIENNDSQYDACGFPVPDLRHYKAISAEYVPMPENVKGKLYVVSFKNRQGDIVVKDYYKTHPMAYTIHQTGGEFYTIVDTTCRKVYDTKYLGKYEVPQCVLELYSKVRPGGYLPGQFEDQEGFIKLRTPEPDDFNPYEDAPLSAGKHWKKACEWWEEDELKN